MARPIKKCTKCPEHQILSDPDLFDWFCDDDVKVVCKATKRKKNEVTVACRPYNVDKECPIPKWCPKKLYVGEVKKVDKPKREPRRTRDNNKKRLDAVMSGK